MFGSKAGAEEGDMVRLFRTMVECVSHLTVSGCPLETNVTEERDGENSYFSLERSITDRRIEAKRTGIVLLLLDAE